MNPFQASWKLMKRIRRRSKLMRRSYGQFSQSYIVSFEPFLHETTNRITSKLKFCRINVCDCGIFGPIIEFGAWSRPTIFHSGRVSNYSIENTQTRAAQRRKANNIDVPRTPHSRNKYISMPVPFFFLRAQHFWLARKVLLISQQK